MFTAPPRALLVAACLGNYREFQSMMLLMERTEGALGNGGPVHPARHCLLIRFDDGDFIHDVAALNRR